MPLMRIGLDAHDAILFDAETGGGSGGDANPQPLTPPKSGGSTTPNGGSDELPEFSTLPPAVREHIKALRQSEAAARVKAKEFEQNEQKRLDEARKAEEERLAKQQEWQALAEKRAKELDALKPVAERAAQLEARITAANQARIEKVPEALRSVIPTDYDAVKLSEWLDANLDKLSKAPAPNTDGGRTGDRTPPQGKVQLTPIRK